MPSFEVLGNKKQEVIFTQEEQEVQKTLETSLESIDYQKLQTVFDRHLKKYGIAEKRELLPKNRFKSDLPSERKSIAVYKSQSQTIHFSPYWVQERFSSVDMKIATGMIVCHEQTHHMSHRSCALIGETETHTVQRTQSGLDEFYEYIPKEAHGQLTKMGGQVFTFLNEGITEMFSREILAEYLALDTAYASKTSTDHFFEQLPQLELAYNKIVPVVETMISSIAERTGVDSVTVKESLYGAMLRGEPMSDPELVAAFSELYGEDFLVKLARQPIRGDTAEISQHLAQQ